MLQLKAWGCIDLGNHKASDGRRQEMNQSKASDRKEHPETEALWQKVSKAAAAEPGYQPPLQKVCAVKSAFTMAGRAAQRQQAGGLIQLLFDSFSQPAAAGVRSESMRIRQMLYRADPYQIDFHIESQPEQNRYVITGQLVDLSHPEMVGRDVEVTISDGRESIVNTITNQFGEFHGEVKDSGDLEITFVGRTGKPIVILLRGALHPSADAKE
jgi:hypothetical protein